MSADVDMYSDDDKPIRLKAGPSHQNGHVVANGNGRAAQESSMSEDDDQPLSQVSRVKSESMTPVRAVKRKKLPSDTSSSEEDKPLSSSPAKPRRRARTNSARAINGKKKAVETDDDDDDAPITKSKRATTTYGKAASKPAKKKVKHEEEDADYPPGSESDENPITKKAPRRVKRKLKSDGDDNGESSSDDEKPITKAKKAPTKRARKEKASSEASTRKPNGKVKSEEPEPSPKRGKKKEEDVFRWWEQDPNGDGTVKWQTLEHNGVYFPPPYEPLPRHVKMKYNGKTLDLPLESEEVAGFYAAMLETEHAKDATFNKNFFSDWIKVLKKHPPRDGTKVTEFNLCDFRPMYEFFEEEKARKKSMTAAEKKEAKATKDALEAPYTHCVLDARKEKVGNFRVEPPGLFRGRGDHPKKGALKLRVRPEDITINIGEGVPIPKPNVPGQWKEVMHDNTVTWLATWTENVNGNHKYVFLAAGSSIKGQSDMQKFEKARELKQFVDRIRQDYNVDLKSKVMADRQRATAMYFIDRLALRAGNEKGEDEADTLVFDFLGKDSIRYYNQVTVEDQVFKNIRIFKDGKDDNDGLFDRVNTSSLNKHLASYMKGLTAKVFRTYNASITFQQQLDQGISDKKTVQEKLNAYNHANRMVAILCNHQRAVPKTHEQSMGKMKDKLRGMKYERMKLRHAMFAIDSKYKKKAKYAQDESDLDDDAIAEHEEQAKAKELERVEKKFAKDNEKLVEEGKQPQDESVLKTKRKEVEDEFKILKKERGTGKAVLKRDRPLEKIEEAIEKLDEKIKTFKLQMEDREAGKEVALGTSKINYLDPRITAAWCKTHGVPIEKIFSKTLLTKFPWAMEVESDWKF